MYESCTPNFVVIRCSASCTKATHRNIFKSAFKVLLAKCKNIDQWRAMALAAGCPSEATIACRSINDCGRLIALKFIADKDGEPVSIDLQSNDSILSEAGNNFLA